MVTKYRKNPFVDDSAGESRSCDEEDHDGEDREVEEEEDFADLDAESLGSDDEDAQEDEDDDDLADFVVDDHPKKKKKKEEDKVPVRGVQRKISNKEKKSRARGEKEALREAQELSRHLTDNEDPDLTDSEEARSTLKLKSSVRSSKSNTGEEKSGKIGKKRIISKSVTDDEVDEIEEFDEDDHVEEEEQEEEEEEEEEGEEDEEEEENHAGLHYLQDVSDEEKEIALIRSRVSSNGRRAALNRREEDHTPEANGGLSDTEDVEVVASYVRSSSSLHPSSSSSSFSSSSSSSSGKTWSVGDRFICKEPPTQAGQLCPIRYWMIRYLQPGSYTADSKGNVNLQSMTHLGFSTCVEVSHDGRLLDNESLQCFLIPVLRSARVPPLWVTCAIAKSLDDRLSKTKKAEFRSGVFGNNNRMFIPGSSTSQRLITCPAYYEKILKDYQRAQSKNTSRQVKTKLASLRADMNISLPSEELRSTLMHLFKFWLESTRDQESTDFMKPFDQYHNFGVIQLPRLQEADGGDQVKSLLSSVDFKAMMPVLSHFMYMLPSLGEEFRSALVLELVHRDGGNEPKEKSARKPAKRSRASR